MARHAPIRRDAGGGADGRGPLWASFVASFMLRAKGLMARDRHRATRDAHKGPNHPSTPPASLHMGASAVLILIRQVVHEIVLRADGVAARV
jgi:hypothetical protein